MMLLFRTPVSEVGYGAAQSIRLLWRTWGTPFKDVGVFLWRSGRLSWASCDLAKGPLAAAFLHNNVAGKLRQDSRDSLCSFRASLTHLVQYFWCKSSKLGSAC